MYKMWIRKVVLNIRSYSVQAPTKLCVNNKEFETDSFTNVTPKILSYVNKNLHLENGHPLSFIRERIVNYFYDKFKGRTGNPIFSVYDKLSPIVNPRQNFDSLLVPPGHVSRSRSDCYYINYDTLLRSHMTAHQSELMQMGLNNFLMVGDVYRRDEIDSTHFPAFHQLDGVRLLTSNELFIEEDDGKHWLEVMERSKKNQIRTNEKQEVYTSEASKMAETRLKTTLEGLSYRLFGSNVQLQWVDAYFPFTHPSWELEIKQGDVWVEVLGCGIMEHNILRQAGCESRIGWAFGLGLERLAMLLYNIPDVRLFWSLDSGFTSQFCNKTCTDHISYRPVSQFPQCYNDLSFWIPTSFTSNDFYDVARSVGGDVVEQVKLMDVFENPKTGLVSHCYRIVYRHMEKTLTQAEVSAVHKNIANASVDLLQVKIR